MFLDKKGVVYSTLVLLIIGIVTFVVILGFITSLLDSSNLESSKQDCFLFFDLVSKGSGFYNDDLTGFYDTFWSAAASTCASESVEVSKSNINEAAELVLDCWKITGSGVDIFPIHAQDQGVCVYCGEIKLDGINSEEFSSKFKDEINSEKYDHFFNKETQVDSSLQLIRESRFNLRSDGNSFGVFYYAKRFSFDSYSDDVFSFYGEMFSSIGSIPKTLLDSLIDTPLNTKAGISFGEIIKIEDDDFYIKFNGEELTDFPGCKMIVPDKHFN